MIASRKGCGHLEKSLSMRAMATWSEHGRSTVGQSLLTVLQSYPNAFLQFMFVWSFIV